MTQLLFSGMRAQDRPRGYGAMTGMFSAFFIQLWVGVGWPILQVRAPIQTDIQIAFVPSRNHHMGVEIRP
jgi:hypothetical protein